MLATSHLSPASGQSNNKTHTPNQGLLDPESWPPPTRRSVNVNSQTVAQLSDGALIGEACVVCPALFYFAYTQLKELEQDPDVEKHLNVVRTSACLQAARACFCFCASHLACSRGSVHSCSEHPSRVPRSECGCGAFQCYRR